MFVFDYIHNIGAYWYSYFQKSLKEAISDKDGPSIVNLMNKLGEETTAAASKGENGESLKIKMLGKALTAGAKAISKLV